MSSDVSCWLSWTVLDGRMTGDEMEVRDGRAGTGDGNACVLAVHRCRIERSGQRSSLVGPDGRTIEPFDSVQWSMRRADRPFAAGGVGNRERGDVARRVVPGDHRVARALPSVVPLGIRGRPRRLDGGPPGCRVQVDRVERQDVARRTRPPAGDAENDGGTAVVVGQAVTARIELQPGDGLDRPPLARAQRGAVAEHGIPRRFVGPPPRGSHASGLPRSDDLRERGFLAGAQVQHTASGRVPGPRPGDVDVDVVFI